MSDPAEVEDYLAALPDERRDTVRAVHETVRSAVPDLDTRLWSDRLIGMGATAIRFKRLEDLDLDVVRELSRRAAELVRAGRFAM